mgnify:CR=1 FL=1|jgi:uncharacterized protein with PIN domain|tara:strand:- start:4680 stop:4994 length:315 start_codon:yes stop_codon:yes gene_type:complete
MSRITAESIRQQMADLRSQLERLEEFNKRGFTPEKCPEGDGVLLHDTHDWSAIHSEHDYNAYWSVLMECRNCGTRQWWHYKFEESNEEDPWTDLRPEEPEEEDE